MIGDPRHYVTADHLRRRAIQYIRQSTERQVLFNTESTRRQYDLKEDLVALGWTAENIEVIDEDQAHSGAYVAGRTGFQRLVEEVSQGRVGVVAGLEVSRLCRDNADWAYLVKICRLTDTLLLDQYALYDPKDPNDRILLNAKGSQSEVELIFIRARLQGAVLNRARRGEFRAQLPVGFVYDEDWRVHLDPDERVQDTLRHFFEVFRRAGSAKAAAETFWREGVRFPCRIHSGPHKGEIEWRELTYGRANHTLHNPRYAGTYFYGKRIERRKPDGKARRVRQPQEKWISCKPGAHPGYISWEEFEKNQATLRANCPGGNEDFRSTPREGPALLQGLVLCGACGRRMTIAYGKRGGERCVPIYLCDSEHQQRGRPHCQRMSGDRIDEAVGKLLVETVNPTVVESAMKVHQELQTREDQAARLRQQAVDRAQYEADLAHRRFLKVDPENRLVAGSLERTWNEKLQTVARAQAELEASQASSRVAVNRGQQEALRTLQADFASLWNDPRTSHREKKRLARLILEDVTLLKGENVTINVRFKGGATRTLTVRRPPTLMEYTTKPEVLRAVAELVPHMTDTKIAETLDNRGIVSGMGTPFNEHKVQWLRHHYRLGERSATRDRGADGKFRKGHAPALSSHVAALPGPGVVEV